MLDLIIQAIFLLGARASLPAKRAQHANLKWNKMIFDQRAAAKYEQAVSRCALIADKMSAVLST